MGHRLAGREGTIGCGYTRQKANRNSVENIIVIRETRYEGMMKQMRQYRGKGQ